MRASLAPRVDPPPGATWRATGLGLVALLAAALLLVACDDDRPTLGVFAAASLSDVFERAAERFEQEHDVEVRFAFGGSQRLRLQLEQGAQADVFASADERQMQRVVQSGLTAAAPQEFARNALVLVVADDLAIDDASQLSRDARLIVADQEVPAGRLTRDVLAERGESALLDAVVSEEDNVRAVLTKVAVGEADAGYVYASDARSESDVRALPLGSDQRNSYLAAPLAGSSSATLAAQFVAFLQAVFVQELLREAGFETVAIDPAPEAGS